MRFAIRFVSWPPTRWHWIGHGELALEADRIVLSGRRWRLFRSGTPQEIALPLSEVRNVTRRAKQVSFEVTGSQPPTQTLRTVAADEESVAQIVALLPKERTTDFARRQDEQLAFDQALGTLHSRALVTPALVVANVGVFIAAVLAGAGVFDPDPTILVRWGSNFGPDTLDGEWWRLFTSMFLHFGLLHLLFNMWALWSVGRLTERLYGSAAFALLYVFAGLCGSLASIAWHPQVNSAGASGAIFGVLGALLAFMVNPRTHIPASVATAQRNSALVFVAYNLLNGFTHTGIDNACHIGGLLGGIAMGWLLARPLQAEAPVRTGPRLALGVIAGTLVLLGSAWPLAHPTPLVAAERRFTKEVHWFVAEDTALVAQQQALLSLARSKSLSDAQFGQRVTQTLVPRWLLAENRLDATTLPPASKLNELRTELLRYAYGYRLGLELLAAAASGNDLQKLTQAQQLLKEASERAKKIRGLLDTLL